MYYVLLPSDLDRKWVLDELNRNHVSAVSHYVPLHSSPAGRRYSRAAGALPVTDSVSERLIRLPMWVGLTEDHQQRVVNVLGAALEQIMLRRHSPRYGVP
jgi:dTDP-4-amino-4,6-dideoxygalactose transaminase